MYKVKKFLQGAAKEFDPKGPVLQQDPAGRTINNLWTGQKPGGKGNLLIGTGALGMGGYTVYSAPGRMLERETEMQDIESLPGTRGDMTGYMANPGTNTDLEANGDLVFALHKLRHGS